MKLSLREAFAGLVLASAGIAASAAALALGGRLNWRLDVLAHFAPVYGALALVCALIGAFTGIPGRRAVLSVSIVGLIAAAMLMVPEFLRPSGRPAPQDAPGQVKVIQFNAMWTNADIRRVADWLITQDADIITISEARHDLRDLLLARTGWKTAGAHGDLIIFTPSRYIRMDRPTKPGGWDVTFVNARYANPSGPIEAMTTHFVWPTEPVAPRQVLEVEEVVGRLPRERMILTGDFNAAPWSAELRRLDRRLGLLRRDRAVATYPAQLFGRPWPLPFLAIDHIYAGRDWATVKVERGPWLGSDHYPLIVTLAPVAPQ